MASIKSNKTFSLDKEVLAEVTRTKGKQSESERVNALLRLALDLEKRAALDREAALFFATGSSDDAARRAFQSASARSWNRD